VQEQQQQKEEEEEEEEEDLANCRSEYKSCSRLVSSRLVFGVHISYRLVANAAAAAGSKGRQRKSSSTIRCLGGDMCS